MTATSVYLRFITCNPPLPFPLPRALLYTAYTGLGHRWGARARASCGCGRRAGT